jgi:hypothetical protein
MTSNIQMSLEFQLQGCQPQKIKGFSMMFFCAKLFTVLGRIFHDEKFMLLETFSVNNMISLHSNIQ